LDKMEQSNPIVSGLGKEVKLFSSFCFSFQDLANKELHAATETGLEVGAFDVGCDNL